MPETIEEIRNRLLTESRLQPEQNRPGYVNGVLDFYNELKKKEEIPVGQRKE